jgi:hypothetical protein
MRTSLSGENEDESRLDALTQVSIFKTLVQLYF